MKKQFEGYLIKQGYAVETPSVVSRGFRTFRSSLGCLEESARAL